jgi:Gpi18-like mannosyltransferase
MQQRSRRFLRVSEHDLAIALAICGATLVWLSVLDFETDDYTRYLAPWYDAFVGQGRWKGLAGSFSNYYVPYLCLISISTFLPWPKLYSIKAISIVFDYAAAWFVYRLVKRVYPGRSLCYVAAIITLFLPTVLFNGALWGQCDIIYTTALLAVLLAVLQHKHRTALVAYGLALASKPQAIYFAPFLAGLFLGRQLPWRQWWIPMAVYAACGLPAILAGRDARPVLMHWFLQRGQLGIPILTLGAPNVFQWFSNDQFEVFRRLGIMLGAVASAFIAWTTAHIRSTLNRERLLVTSALLSSLLLPFFLPGMHERYFFAADVLSVI